MATEHFSELPNHLSHVPLQQRSSTLIDDICQEMGRSSDLQTRELMTELQSLKPQIVKAFQQ